MKYTLISTMCLLAVFIAEGQKLSFPPNWYKGIGTPLIDECFIEGIPLNNGNFYLFSMQVQKPRNMVSGIWPTAAKLIKTDGNGVEICNFSVGTMSLNNVNSFRGIYSDIINGEIIFFVSEDSAIINKTPINKSVIIYHLDSQTLAYKHSDTLKYLFGKNVSIWNWFTNTIKESTFHALSTIDADGYFSSYCMKIKTDHGGYSIKLLDLDSAISLTNRGVTYVTNSYVDSCNFNVFMTSADTNLTASTVYRFISLDTIATIREFQQIYPEYYYFYEIGKYVNTDLFPQGHRLNKKKAIIGTGFSSNLQMGTNKVCGIMRYDLTTQHADKMLIMNDTTFSLSLKTYPNLNSLLYSGGSVWCAAFDFDDLTNAYLSNQENHIYVGKTDTSLNGWHWYKYIGKPNCYLVPYKILATPDGGCMITAGIYDYVNSPNMQHDIYIIKLDANGGITSVNNLTPQPDKAVSLYPVPAQHQLFVSFSGSGHFDLQLYDMAGKMVGSYPNLDKQTRSLDISTLASGSYFYTVKHSNGSTETGKWIKE